MKKYRLVFIILLILVPIIYLIDFFSDSYYDFQVVYSTPLDFFEEEEFSEEELCDYKFFQKSDNYITKFRYLNESNEPVEDLKLFLPELVSDTYFKLEYEFTTLDYKREQLKFLQKLDNKQLNLIPSKRKKKSILPGEAVNIFIITSSDWIVSNGVLVSVNQIDDLINNIKLFENGTEIKMKDYISNLVPLKGKIRDYYYLITQNEFLQVILLAIGILGVFVWHYLFVTKFKSTYGFLLRQFKDKSLFGIARSILVVIIPAFIAYWGFFYKDEPNLEFICYQQNILPTFNFLIDERNKLTDVHITQFEGKIQVAKSMKIEHNEQDVNDQLKKLLEKKKIERANKKERRQTELESLVKIKKSDLQKDIEIRKPSIIDTSKVDKITFDNLSQVVHLPKVKSNGYFSRYKYLHRFLVKNNTDFKIKNLVLEYDEHIHTPIYFTIQKKDENGFGISSHSNSYGQVKVSDNLLPNESLNIYGFSEEPLLAGRIVSDKYSVYLQKSVDQLYVKNFLDKTLTKLVYKSLLFRYFAFLSIITGCISILYLIIKIMSHVFFYS